jgi:hypothetical protein
VGERAKARLYVVKVVIVRVHFHGRNMKHKAQNVLYTLRNLNWD